MPSPSNFEDHQTANILLEILALSDRDIEEGRVRPIENLVLRLRARQAEA